ncbi:protein MLP1 [Siniperca chuatsi]|uniref:protein MLP1 n=1 Tax=Siniperca chuatsi TaxID=119488 RepID=UPI001CE1A7F0|nr:protein MLP1 [Siniperca chuatsi]
MAVGSHFIWIPFLLSCVFQASDSRHVRQFVSSGHTGNSEITPSVGIDPKNVNVMLNIKTCTDNETSALRRETRLLKLQLSTCSSTASAITGSYQTQVQNKMKRLLETYDSDTFLILKIITLTREVNTLQKKIKHAANSTENTFEITALQRELQEKTNELNVKTQQIERSHTNASLILQIISLQNQIWDLEQAKSRSGETSLQIDKRILALQEQMDLLISQQRGKGYADIDMLELISVHSKIAVMQRLIRVHIEQSRVNAADYQRQWRQKVELLKRKILQLNRDENNIDLTKDILKLQAEIENFRQLLTNSKTTTDFQLKELRFILEEEKKKQDKLQKQLEEEEYGQAQLIMKIINIMNELRELDVEEQGQTTSTSQATTLQTLLQAKEMEYAKAQDKINELQRELRLKNEKCSGLEEKYEQVKTEYEQTIVDLKRTGNDKAALILNVINLHDELKTLSALISTTKDPERISELQRQLEEKQEELNSKTADIERLIANPKIILTIIELQNEIWDLEKTAANSDRVKELQNRVDGLITEIDDEGDENTKLMLKIMTLQSQVGQLQRQLSDLQKLETSQATRKNLQLTFTNPQASKFLQIQLHAKGAEHAKAQAEVRVLNVINLHDELKTLSALISTTKDPERISELQRQLEEKQEELNSKTADIERLIANPKIILTIIELQNEIWDLEKTAANSDRVKGDENTKLMLKIMTLQSQVGQLQRQLSDLQKLETSQATQLANDLTTTKKELQKYVNELNEKNQTNARLILTVTDLHNQLRNLDKEQRNNNTSFLTITQLREQLKAKMTQHSHDQAEIKVLQIQLHAKGAEHAKAQAEVRELQRKLRLKNEKCSGLEEKYEQVKTEYEQTIVDLKRTGNDKAALILNVINLHDELKTLSALISTTKDPERISELQRQLEEKQEELNSKTADIERLIANPKIILTIIELQNEIWDLEKTAANSDRVKELQNRVDGLITEIDAAAMLKIMTLQSQVGQLQRQLSDLQKLETSQATQLINDLTTTKKELQKYVNELNEKNQTNARLILTVTDLHNQLRNLDKEKNNVIQTASAASIKLREQLKAKVEEHSRNQAEIKALQNQLNQTEAQCSSYEQKLQELQNDLDAKLTDLQSKSDTVTSLALQVSTLTLQVEELKRQLQNTQSETKIKELQKIIDEKTNELAKKTEALKAKSAQPQRILQIIAIQTEIEKLAIVATNDTHYNKIRALQDHLNYLIEGIQDENSENTQLIFKILARQDEIAKLRKQKEAQIQAELEKIKDLENELEDVRNQIKQKTLLLHSSDTRIANLSAEIMELHKKIKPLEVKISDLKGENAQNLEEYKKRLDLTKRQLQDSELLLKETDANNFKLIMEIADLRAQLTKTQKKASKAIQKNINELEQEIQAQQRENRKLENANKDLEAEVNILNIRCSDANTRCDHLQRQLQQSQEDLNHLQKEYNNLERQLQQGQDNVHYLQQQLHEKDSRLSQLQQELEEQTREYNKLQDNYKNLQNKLIDEEDKTIIAWKMAFDPNTANPRIALSDDNTVMSTTAEMQNVPELPGRFDVVLAVLGSTGFSSGRRYWEVSVAGKLCYHLGMASESIQRKGSMAFNPTNGFWTIVLNKQGQYRAIDKIPVIIPVQTQPLTLGILLDYKKGQISFYDAGARSHMYSFVGQSFTDKIFPFINFCVEDVDSQIPIVLLAPGPTDWIK